MLIKITYISVLIILASSATNTVIAGEQAQAVLDEACEAAREVALKPQRKKIYLKCRNTFRESHEICMGDAFKYNGNRDGDIPLYYDLPECLEALDYREDNK